MRDNEVAEISQISLSEIKELGGCAGPCVSILLPLDTARQQVAGNSVRLKNAVREVERLLGEKGVEPERTRVLLEPIREYTAELGEWSGDRQGLAIFRSWDVLRAFRVPLQLEESVSVADHFNVRPLLTLVHADPTFYILALSQKHIRLLRCMGHSSEE